LEIATNSGIQTAQLEVVYLVKEVTARLQDLAAEDERRQLYDWFKHGADHGINHSPLVFKVSVRSLRDAADFEFERSKEALDQICRILGWLGERLWAKKALSPGALMPGDETTEHDELLEALEHIGSNFNDIGQGKYPLIYFDAVDVILRKLVEQGASLGYELVRSPLQSFIYSINSFVDRAIRADNPDGVILGLITLNRFRDLFISRNALEFAKEVTEAFLENGLLIARSKLTTSNGYTAQHIANRGLNHYTIETLTKFNDRETIESKMMDTYVRYTGKGDYEAGKLWIKQLGSALHTNFGLRFNPETGEDYPRLDDSNS
jgi:hypothetical protein